MNKVRLMVCTMASAASIAGIANAVPFGGNDLPAGLSAQGESPHGLTIQRGNGESSPVNLVSSTSKPVVVVPEGGTTLVFLGIGLLALVFVRRHLPHIFT
jgi:hypothetical protein